MKIIIDYSNSDSELNSLKIDSAKYLSDYVIRIKFNNSFERVLDFKPFLAKSVHPSITKYLDENNFANFSVTDGNLNWNDFELIFPIQDLYFGHL